MKYATIGTSWITEAYIAAADRTTRWNLHGVYSRDAEKAEAFRQKHGAAVCYSSLDALGADRAAEAVYIASPNALHFEQSKKMLLAGKHVLCEKPATVTHAQYCELETLAAEKGLVYLEAIMSQYVPALDTIRSRLPLLGSISAAQLDYSQLSSKYPALLGGETPNIFNPALCAGGLMDIGVYNLYLAALLFGEPQSILSSVSFLHTGADACGTAVLQYERLQATLTWSKVGQGYKPSEILGDRGTLQIGAISQLTGVRLRTKQTEELLAADSIERSVIMGGEASFFHRAITAPDAVRPAYTAAHETAGIVRRMCDTIRKQNGFPF